MHDDHGMNDRTALAALYRAMPGNDASAYNPDIHLVADDLTRALDFWDYADAGVEEEALSQAVDKMAGLTRADLMALSITLAQRVIREQRRRR